MSNPFSMKLKALRESRGKKQNEIADHLGVGNTYLSALERGRKVPPHQKSFYEKLAQFLDLSGDELRELSELADSTRLLGDFAQGITAAQLALAIDFVKRLPTFTPSHIRAVRAVLELEDLSAQAQRQQG